MPLPFARHSFSSHTKHSRFFHGRFTPTTELLCEHWELTTWWALQVPLLREQKEIWSLKKITQLARDQVRCMHNTGSSPKLCLSSNRTGGTNLQQPGNHGHGSTQQRAFLALSLHSHTLSASALKPKWKVGFYLKTIALGIITDMVRPVRKREAKLFKFINCIHWLWHSQVLSAFSF